MQQQQAGRVGRRETIHEGAERIVGFGFVSAGGRKPDARLKPIVRDVARRAALTGEYVAHAGERAVGRLRVRADLLQLLQLAPGAVRRQVVVEGPLWHVGVGEVRRRHGKEIRRVAHVLIEIVVDCGVVLAWDDPLLHLGRRLVRVHDDDPVAVVYGSVGTEVL